MVIAIPRAFGNKEGNSRACNSLPFVGTNATTLVHPYGILVRNIHILRCLPDG